MRAEVRAATCFLVATAAAVGLAVVYFAGGQTQLEGILLAITSGGIGAGIVIWAKAYMPHGEVTEERGRLESTEDEVAAFTADFEAGEQTVTRRRLLLASAGAAFAALGVALLFPIRSLGPNIRAALRRTPYDEAPIRVVREDGEPVRADDLPIDGVITVWPEGHTDAADAPTLLIRTRPTQPFEVREGREDWTVDGVVAYSKLCTHTGCPVGLYQAEEGLLLCPCHQSTFDVYDGARPMFGPATRSLPQLPLAVDDDGYLIATRRLLRPRRAGLLGPRPVMETLACSGCAGAEPPPRPLDRRPARRRRFRSHRAQQGLPRPLVVHARRAGALLLHRPRAHRHVPDVLLRRQSAGGDLRRQLRAAARRRDDRRLPVGARPQLRRPRRARHAPDPPLGRAAVPGVARRAHGPGLLHRRVPPAPGGQLDHRGHAARARDLQRLRRLLAARRPVVGHRACGSPTRSRCRSRSSGRGWRRSSSAASSPGPTSSAAST